MKKALIFISLVFILFTACKQKSNEKLLEEWITEHAFPIKTVEAGNGFEDLIPIGDMVGDARIVSLGEPTHGNSEVFQMKLRLTEYLVTEKGFNLFALECPFGEAFDVNKYILEGKGSPEEALAGIYYWTWDTQEFVELLKWMRAYNADTTHTTKLKFYGFDMQDPERAARKMLDYIKKVDPDLWQSVISELSILEIQFSDPVGLGRRPYIPEEYDEASLAEIKRVMNSFEKKKAVYITATSEKEWELAKQHARQIEIYIEAALNDGEKWSEMRDRAQAENIQWALDQEGLSSKVIVSAHNCHVSNAAPKDEINMHGYYLRKRFGDQLKIFGMFFNKGGFKAMDVNMPSKGIYNISLDEAPSEALEHVLASANHTLAVLNMNDLPDKGPVHEWFYSLHPTRHSGAGYNEERPEEYFWSYIPAEAYDVLVYFDRTHPVVSVNDTVYEYNWMLNKKEPFPTNLNFEKDSTGYAPVGWMVWSKFKRLGVKLETTDENPYEGKYSAKLSRPSGVSFGEITPNLTQRIDASQYKGKIIRISAACRSEVKEPGFAFFRLSIDPGVLESAHDGMPPLFDSLDKTRIDSSKWKIYEIEAKVPEEAESITYGIYLRDPGTVWIDDIEIEVIE